MYKNNQKINLCIDVFNIHGIECMISIDREVKYRSMIHITTHNKEVFFNSLEKIIRKYN